MNAWRLPDGRVLVPRRAEGPGLVGDGLVLVERDSDAAREWSAWTRPATPDIVEWWNRVEASRQSTGSTSRRRRKLRAQTRTPGRD